MKAPFSEYLTGIAEGLKKLTAVLDQEFDYVSILASDTKGLNIRVSGRSKSVSNETVQTERGIVVRTARDGYYSEYATNLFDPRNIQSLAEQIRKSFEEQNQIMKAAGVKPYETPVLNDEPLTLFVEMETEQLPETADVQSIVGRLTEITERESEKREEIRDCILSCRSNHVSKMFLTKNRDLRQSYVFSEASAYTLAARGDRSEAWHEGASGRCGPELFEKISECAAKASDSAVSLLDAERIVPGEYEIITTPEVSGLIAHEAFGHGVEMDMFVKNRALGKEYIGKRVGSDLVTMHEGALCAEEVSSYAFDDEGILAGDVTEIENGILRTGICDALSALRLGTVPTGNGKRENYSHKVYTRMTNTIFDSGESTAEEMIASVKKGYLLVGMQSGMEDPKHWGIQCIISSGHEIIDGKLTGKIVSPVIMTGYVPDLLGNVSMVSGDREVFGCGMCGKGYKEWVKVSDGGPYLKTKARLG